MKINPIKLSGPWAEGFALDRHIISSVYIGEDEWGHKHFDNTRSDIGELIYQFKYNGDKRVLSEIINLVIPFVSKDWLIHKRINLIIPIPPSNLNREFQPVVELSKAVGRNLDISVDLEVLCKTNSTQLKGLSSENKQNAISDALHITKTYSKPTNVLLIDDLYDSGTTLKTATKLLLSQKNINNVYVLTMTKTKGR